MNATELMRDPGFIVPGVLVQVRAEMKAQRVTQAELGRRAGIPVSTLHKKLAGKSCVYVTDLLAIADVLGVKLSAWVETVEAAAQWIVGSLGSRAGLDDIDAIAEAAGLDVGELVLASLAAREAVA